MSALSMMAFGMLSLAALPGMWERTIVINGFSKCYDMTGWRIGYVVAQRQISDALLPIAHGMTICAPSVAQYAALAALTGPTDWFNPILAEYDRRRRLWMQALNSMGLPYGRPRGAYYITMPQISSTRPDLQATGEGAARRGQCDDRQRRRDRPIQ